MPDVVFLDTNVLLDVLLNRQPFAPEAQRIWSLAEKRQIRACVSAATFLNVYYIVRRLASRQQADRAVRGLRAIFQILPIDSDAIDQAIESPLKDFEDAVQHACTLRARALCIITRDERHFSRSSLPVISPDAFLARPESK